MRNIGTGSGDKRGPRVVRIPAVRPGRRVRQCPAGIGPQRASFSGKVQWATRSLRATSAGHVDKRLQVAGVHLPATPLTRCRGISTATVVCFNGGVLVGLGREAVAPGGVQAAVTGDLGHQYNIGLRADQVGHEGVAQHVGRQRELACDEDRCRILNGR